MRAGKKSATVIDMPAAKVAIFTNNDNVWSLPTWRETLPLLQQDYEVVGIGIFPDRLAGRVGLQIPLWYLKNFGLINFILLTLFALKRSLANMFTQTPSWGRLANANGCKLFRGKNPNSPESLTWLKSLDVDVLFIMVGDIIGKDILQIPKRGTINKHAALLPSAKGLFPYFWAKLKDLPLGISFHKVVPKIDSGKLLVQETVSEEYGSMLAFYRHVFERYPELACQACKHLLSEKHLEYPQDVPDSYFSLPTRKDVAEFARKGGSLARLGDLI